MTGDDVVVSQRQGNGLYHLQYNYLQNLSFIEVSASEYTVVFFKANQVVLSVLMRYHNLGEAVSLLLFGESLKLKM